MPCCFFTQNLRNFMSNRQARKEAKRQKSAESEITFFPVVRTPRVYIVRQISHSRFFRRRRRGGLRSESTVSILPEEGVVFDDTPEIIVPRSGLRSLSVSHVAEEGSKLDSDPTESPQVMREDLGCEEDFGSAVSALLNAVGDHFSELAQQSTSRPISLDLHEDLSNSRAVEAVMFV